jgi:KDEL-tailed cysteine endopeptidase
MLSSALSLFVLSKNAFPSFNSWVKFYGKQYPGATERDYRNYVFDANVEKIFRHNTSPNSTWTMAVNKFADLTSSEFKKLYVNEYTPFTQANKTYGIPTSVLPYSVDWTTEGVVTPVKDQGNFSNSWAFSAVAALESSWALKYGVLYNISERRFFNSSDLHGNTQAFDWVLTNYYTVPAKSDLALMTVVSERPVAVAVDMDEDVFQFYSGGVMTSVCGTRLNHGVLLVGYGVLNGQEFYKVKNSWGSQWGDKGYMYLGRGPTFGEEGQCGIKMDVSFPKV